MGLGIFLYYKVRVIFPPRGIMKCKGMPRRERRPARERVINNRARGNGNSRSGSGSGSGSSNRFKMI
jgi:hypothetical protein